jgi:hypothetical protein
MVEDMRLRKLAPKTQAAYIRAARKFTKFLGHSPDTATDEDLRRFQLHMVDEGTSPITLNATIVGLNFLFEVTLLLRPGEVLSRISHPTILEVADNSFWGSIKHRHMFVGGLA